MSISIDDCYEIRMMERYGTTDLRKPCCRCSECDEDLFDGDKFYTIDGKIVCRDCVENMALSDLMDMLQLDRKELLDLCGVSEDTVLYQ